MSHFTRIKTQMVEKQYLMEAIKDLGFAYEEGNAEIRDYAGKSVPVEIKVAVRNSNYAIGFCKVSDGYEMIADQWDTDDINRKQLLRQLSQRYAYHAAKDKLEEQGFSLVSEEQQKDGQIHLLLRRMA